jgi:hypothetical protein
MINFFRKIRKRLADDNKPLKYMRYAVGEILLVVIGILIALSINNWNQNRLNQLDKKEILSKLQIEFQTNKNILQDYKIKNERSMNSNIALMSLIGETKEVLSKQNLDSLFYEAYQGNELAFTENAVKNIVQSGGLNLFKDEKMTTLLNQWNSLSVIRDNRLNKLDSWNNDYSIPFLIPYISFKEMDANANFRWTGKSKVKPDYYPLFQKVEFENLIENSLWYSQNLADRLEETEVLINKIISATKS